MFVRMPASSNRGDIKLGLCKGQSRPHPAVLGPGCQPSVTDIWTPVTFCLGAALCMAGCCTASLASAHQKPVAPPTPVTKIKNLSRQYQMSPGDSTRSSPQICAPLMLIFNPRKF